MQLQRLARIVKERVISVYDFERNPLNILAGATLPFLRLALRSP
jgi:hypothetical protein